MMFDRFYNKIKRARLIIRSFFVKPKYENTTISNKDIVVSLTTYKDRIFEVDQVIDSIYNQTIRPYRVILWLDKDEFNIDSIPDKLKWMMRKGLEIYFTENLRSYKKIIPTIILLADEDIKLNIVTIDDDILYPPDLIEQFLKQRSKNNDEILCNIAHEMSYTNGQLDNYNNWIHSSLNLTSSLNIFPTGVGGVYYPSNSLHNDVTDIDCFMSLAPSADDVWLKAMSLRNNVHCRVIKRDHYFTSEFKLLESNQDIGLFNHNLSGGNDIAIKGVFAKFNLN